MLKEKIILPNSSSIYFFQKFTFFIKIHKPFSFPLKKNKIRMKLLIIGRGVNKREMVNFINKNNLNNIVKIINFIDNPFPYIKKSDVFSFVYNF